ncbi:terpenoid cyclases/Protein prenyltransferase [Punctularia strigosozonata HHB-11173 SS5]|uniref:terpenoid cyclases/Protein prenyltransferase n=1 Tax=Punctularia strigosozonata (strain HHB-11173) TaxID=741275 RepID=UPI0004417259|nr:terpenoid cyclases/Protein prenyltransferase [Punctularia strigosozonata HHB-11173 SS5]EIN12322.1 terpenoid cyclases/Protein prenyltransferase [Punctularia strigosozonata HHB-11173 SS5]
MDSQNGNGPDPQRGLGLGLRPLARTAHAMHAKRCLTVGLPASKVEIDSSRLVLGFYCLGTLDLVDALEGVKEADREGWRAWLWEMQAHGQHGTGFKPSTYMTPADKPAGAEYGEYDAPHLIMTYAALLSLAILRDDFARLDRPGLVRFLAACQREDGSFSSVPGATDADLRLVYCAVAVASMLADLGGIDVRRAVAYIRRCRSYEGGYGQEPRGEALGGTTYCALAALALLEREDAGEAGAEDARLTERERRATVRWLARCQDGETGGFCGRTGKVADACYCFWCGASMEVRAPRFFFLAFFLPPGGKLTRPFFSRVFFFVGVCGGVQILGAGAFVDADRNAAFLGECQFKFGGLAKVPGEHPDPYHTYLSLAVISLLPPRAPANAQGWAGLQPLDALLNAKRDTAEWARKHIPAKPSFVIS